MKKCPTCGKTFDDGMKFCQSDGTPLTAEEPAADVDPFKTMVVSSKVAASGADDVLETSGADDAMKTMVVSDDERREMMSGGEAAKLPDLPAPPEPPKFDEPDLRSPSFGNLSGTSSSSQPPSTPPFSAGSKNKDFFDGEEPPTMIQNDFKPAIDSAPTGPIPSPFDASMPPGYQPPSTPPFQKSAPKPPETPSFQSSEPDQPETPAFQPPPFQEPEPPPSPFGQTPFDNSAFGAADNSYNQPVQQQEWTPPPAPDANWQNQEIGANTPFQPPAAGTGQNQTLAVVSLILGGVSFVCFGPLLSIPAIITGYMQKKNIKRSPEEYGGSGMATAGIILGVVNIVLIAAFLLIYIIVIAGAVAGNR